MPKLLSEEGLPTNVGDEWCQLMRDILNEINHGRYSAEQDPDAISFDTAAGRLIFAKPDE